MRESLVGGYNLANKNYDLVVVEQNVPFLELEGSGSLQVHPNFLLDLDCTSDRDKVDCVVRLGTLMGLEWGKKGRGPKGCATEVDD